MATSIPTEFGKYTIIEQIGEGGFGTVYKARDTTLERTVALKVLHPALLNDPVFVERFQAEARMAAQLEHPNIVRVYEVGEHEGRYYLAMEYVEGQSLAQLLEAQGRLTPQQALKVVGDVASGLEAAHRKQLVHRDIKPSNILIGSDGTALVTDFGLAKAADASLAVAVTTSSQVLGTLRYMSPEQAEQMPVNHLSDIYALGVVLYEMLAGRPPFIGDKAIQLIRAHADKRPPPPSEFNKAITPAVESVVLRALAKKPEERYPTAGKMARALEGAVTKGVAETQTPTWPGAPAEPARPARGFRWEPVIAGALLLLLCGIVAGALALFSGGLGLGPQPTPTAVALVPPEAATDTPSPTSSPQPTATATVAPPTPTDTPSPPTPTSTPTPTHTVPPPTPTPYPTYSPAPPPTPYPTYTPYPTPPPATPIVKVATPTPEPTPTEPANTPPDAVLESGDWWKTDDVWLRLTDVEFSEHGCVSVYLELWNRTGNELIFQWSAPGNFSLVDNTGHRYELHRSSRSEQSEVVEVNGQGTLGNRNTGFSAAWYCDAYFFEPAVTDMLFTVVDLSRISHAKWRIEVPK